MAFKNITYKRTGELSEAEFIDELKKINNAESITGVKYSNIEVMNGIISEVRDSTKEPFSIMVSSLYKAYCALTIFNTKALEPYVKRVQSPAMAVLIAAKLVSPNNTEDTATNVPPRKNTSASETNKSNEIKRKRKRGVDCPFCGNYVNIPEDQDEFRDVVCAKCGNAVHNPNYPEKRIFGIKKSVFITLIVVALLVFGFAFLGKKGSTLIENGELQTSAKVEAITLIKSKLSNPSSYNGNGWIQGDYNKSSDHERYFLLHRFTVTNEHGVKEEMSATVIFDKDGHAVRVEF